MQNKRFSMSEFNTILQLEFCWRVYSMKWLVFMLFLHANFNRFLSLSMHRSTRHWWISTQSAWIRTIFSLTVLEKPHRRGVLFRKMAMYTMEPVPLMSSDIANMHSQGKWYVGWITENEWNSLVRMQMFSRSQCYGFWGGINCTLFSMRLE